jgi:hypothetical protein
MNRLFLLLCVFCQNTFATNTPRQVYHHTSLWSRLSLQKELKKFTVSLDIDYRQQNDFRKNRYNIFAAPSLRWARINSSYTTGRWQHSMVLPAYVKNYSLKATEADLKRPTSTEWRLGFFEEYSQPVGPTFSKLRFGTELRQLTQAGQVRNTARVRIRLQQSWPITKKTNLSLGYEALYNTQPNKPANTFSNSQLSLRYTQRFGQHLSLQTGINHITRKRSSLTEIDLEEALLFNVQYLL